MYHVLSDHESIYFESQLFGLITLNVMRDPLNSDSDRYLLLGGKAGANF